jgi:hypothetical protein
MIGTRIIIISSFMGAKESALGGLGQRTQFVSAGIVSAGSVNKLGTIPALTNWGRWCRVVVQGGGLGVLRPKEQRMFP